MYMASVPDLRACVYDVIRAKKDHSIDLLDIAVKGYSFFIVVILSNLMQCNGVFTFHIYVYKRDPKEL